MSRNVHNKRLEQMTYKMTLSNGNKIDINCPYCGNDEFRSQGPRKHLYHMFQCKKCGKCHNRFLDTGHLVTGGKHNWKYRLQIVKLDDLDVIYKMHDELTDKKILGTITPNEEDILEQIRNKLDDKDLIESLNIQIEQYEEILEKIKLLNAKLKSKIISDKCNTQSLSDF